LVASLSRIKLVSCCIHVLHISAKDVRYRGMEEKESEIAENWADLNNRGSWGSLIGLSEAVKGPKTHAHWSTICLLWNAACRTW
jgi:hypothetical protein